MRVVHWKHETYTVYIGRPSLLGNPFVIGRDGDRATVIAKFKKYASENMAVRSAILNLDPDAVLSCWCKPEPCHGDAIIELYNEWYGIKCP